MRRRRTLALLLAAGMLCSGCSTGAISSNYRAVEDLELIQTIGVDRAPEGVCLSAATGKACENEAPKRMTQSGVSMLAALDQLQDRAPSAGLFYAQTSYLLLGEEAAAAGGLTPLLDFIARDPDMRLSAPLFIVRGGTAQQAVMETGDDKTDVTEALAALEKDITLDGTSHAYSCTDIARALAGSGCAVVGAVACVRTPESEGGKLALAPAGYAIFRDGDYVGSIEPETAHGASMLLGVAGHGNLAVTDRDGSTVMLTLDTCKTNFRPVWGDDGTLARVDVTLKLRAGIAELRAGIAELRAPRRITAREYQDELNAALAALVTSWAEDVIAASQALGADFLGVGQALAIGCGRRWAAIRDDWPAVWQSVPVRVTVSADVGRTFDLRDGIDTSGGGT